MFDNTEGGMIYIFISLDTGKGESNMFNSVMVVRGFFIKKKKRKKSFLGWEVKRLCLILNGIGGGMYDV